MKSVLSKYFRGDPIIWAVILLLSILSVLVVYSATQSLAYKYAGGNFVYYLFRHSLMLLFGYVVLFITHHIPFKYFSRLAQLFLIVTPFLLFITLVMGTSLNEASRWLPLPGTGLTFQTSDFAKLALIMYIARFLAKKQDNIRDFNTVFLPLTGIVLGICLLILPANFSTAALLFSTSLIVMFIGRVKIRYLAGLIGIGIAAISLFISISVIFPESKIGGRVETWKNRVINYSNGESEGNYQVEQAKIAIVTGGIMGKGIGYSTQRNFLPHAYSDFIYAIIIEEYGLIFGGVLVVLLYLILLYRAIVIVQRCTNRFGAFLAVGLTVALVFQAFINMAVNVNLFPVTGQTLPLVSMGGTSIIFTSIAFGVILSVSRSLRENNDDETTI